MIPNPFKIYEFTELVKGVKFSKSDLVLDIGCGSGFQTLLLSKKCHEIMGIDISEGAISTSKRWARLTMSANSTFVRTNMEESELPDNSFDKVFSICVLEHIYDYMSTLTEIYRVLNQEGQLILSVDSLESIMWNTKLINEHMKEYFVQHYFTKGLLEESLKNVGFNRIEIYPIFRSYFARNLFVTGIENKFHYNYLQSILYYFLLKKAEKNATSQKGIFLVAKCYKAWE